MSLPTPHATTQTALSRTTPLALLGELSVHLAEEGPLDGRLLHILETLRAGIDARACELWLLRGAGSERVAGAREIPAAHLPAPYGPVAEPVDDVEMVPINTGERQVGTLIVWGERSGPDQRLLLSTAANLLAGAIRAEERSRGFAEEAASRTREVDAQRRFIQSIVDSLPVGLHVVDREFRVHAWNRKRETGLHGILREEALGRTIFEVLRRQPADLLRQEFNEVFRTGEMLQLEMESLATGEPRTYRISKIPMRTDGAAVTHVITIGEDITDWKRAQESIAEAEKMAALGQLSAGVMHEINNPLATVAACAESMALQLGSDAVPDSAKESLTELCRIIDHEVHRCKRIVDRLLDFSQPRARDRGAVDMNAVVSEVLFLLRHHPRFKGLKIETVLDGSIRLIHGDRDQLTQVLMSLLLNAVDAIVPGGGIRIRTWSDGAGGSSVVLEVEDDGQGIPASELGRLFEPFYTTKAPGRGTGLGLSICYAIITDHGGRVDVESEVGRGSTFRVRLPAERAA